MSLMFKNSSVRTKFGTLVRAILAVVFGVIAILVYTEQKATLRSVIEERARLQLGLLAEAAASALLVDDSNILAPLEQQLAGYEDLIHVTVIDRGGRLIFEIGKSASQDQSTVVFFRPIRAGEETIGEARLVISTDKADRAAVRALLQVAAVCVIGLVLTVWATYVVFGRLATGPITRLTEITGAVAAGNLRHSPTKVTNDELGELAGALGKMIDSLRDIVTRISELVHNTGSAANEICAGIEEQERTLAAQANSINEMSTTIEELAQSSGQVGKTAEGVSGQCREVLQTTEEGNRSVQKGVQEMNFIKGKVSGIAQSILNLSEQIQKISSIVYTVANIAEQTNILALNAGVEAARAGDHGKGFAVVATEVRKLADQSQKAAAQIRVIIEDIQNASHSTILAVEEGSRGLESGVKQVLQAGDTLQTVTSTIKRTVEQVQEISMATCQQAIGIDQVSEAMHHIDQGMQETLSGTQQITTAASQLVTLGQSLQELVNRFELADGGQHRALTN